MAATQDEIIAGLAEIIEEVTGIEPSEVTMETVSYTHLTLPTTPYV